MDNVKERLYEYLKSKNLKASVFERQCGLSNGFCSKAYAKISEGSLMLIQKGAPDLNINWLKTGQGEMLNEAAELDNSNSDNPHTSIPAMMRMMQEFISIGKKNSEANILNAEANKMNARNLERLIDLIEHKVFDRQ